MVYLFRTMAWYSVPSLRLVYTKRHAISYTRKPNLIYIVVVYTFFV